MKDRYEEALERARKIYDSASDVGDITGYDLETIFPELRESEDERIRKQCIKLLREAYSTKYEAFECIAWLEKQKEQKPISSCDIVPYIDDKIAALQDMWREEKVAFDWDDVHEMIEDVARHFYQKEQKPAEWSEEDENALEYLHELIGFGYTEKFMDAQTAADMREWVNKSLRPSWKPSEAQMKALGYAISGDFDKIKPTSYLSRRLEEIEEQLKKLM